MIDKQWTDIYTSKNPTDADAFTTGFCNLPISVDNSYYCQVYSECYNFWWDKVKSSEAVKYKRHANIMIDTEPRHLKELNGFSYGFDFSPTVGPIGFGCYALIVCIKRK